MAKMARDQEPQIVLHPGHVDARDRSARFGQTPLTVWLTGLSGAGKSTLAFSLEKRLFDAGLAVYVLDGDNLRHGLSRDLGFSEGDRTENIRRVAEVAALMNDAGLVVVTAFISPLRSDRTMACGIIGRQRFVEVHVATPLPVCEIRDPKGLYRKARRGEIPEFTGISAPYEAPERPDIALSTENIDVAGATDLLYRSVLQRSRLPSGPVSG